MLTFILFARLTLALQVATAPVHNDRVIVRLVCRQQTVSIASTKAGVRYSAADQSGKTLFSSLTIEQIKADHPEIFRLIIPTVCSTDGRAIIADTDYWDSRHEDALAGE